MPESIEYGKHSDDELRTLARNIIDGHVFTSAHLKGDMREVARVFIALSLMSDEQRAKLPDDVGLVYEYNDRQTNRGGFLSFQLLSAAEANRLADFMWEIERERPS